MKFWIRTLSVALGLSALTATGALAGDNSNARLALHVATRTSKNLCTVNLPSSCNDYSTSTSSSGFYTIYLTIAGYDDTIGVAGAQFGVSYDNMNGVGADIWGWKSCSDFEFREDNWPASGTGNLITWDWGGNCQRNDGVPLTAGAFDVTVYSGDVFSLTPRPVDGMVKVAGCDLVETDITDAVPSRLGQVGFGTTGGYNPCLGPSPVHPRTWGSIKALYEQ
ncbi:MAG TPA: hypothetical protein VFP10_06345 [Candidatus Eisenbacteria bacterium]|nr:hypothetical protein [Candidatus Eisenbacteria bacterium]